MRLTEEFSALCLQRRMVHIIYDLRVTHVRAIRVELRSLIFRRLFVFRFSICGPQLTEFRCYHFCVQMCL